MAGQAPGTTKDGSYSWWLYGENNEQTAWAGETFPSMANATRAAQSFKAGATTARFEVYTDTGGSWRWRAWRGSDKVASSGESFANEYSAQRAVATVQANAPAHRALAVANEPSAAASSTMSGPRLA